MANAEIDVKDHATVASVRYVPLRFEMARQATYLDSNGSEHVMVPQTSRLKNIAYACHVGLRVACIQVGLPAQAGFIRHAHF
jgi:hypothetical protein